MDPWINQAACRDADNPNLWTSDSARDQKKAIWFCDNLCPVVWECANFAIKNDEPFNVWGGFTPEERRYLK